MSNLSRLSRIAGLAATVCLLANVAGALTVSQFQDGVHGRSQRLATPPSTAYADDITIFGFGSRTAVRSSNFVDRTDQVMRFDYFNGSLGTLDRVIISYEITRWSTNRVYVDDFTCNVAGLFRCVTSNGGSAIPTVARATGSVGYGIEIEPYAPTAVGAPTGGFENPSELEVRSTRVSESVGQDETGSTGLNATGAPTYLEITGPQAASFVGNGQFDIMPLFVSYLEISASCGGNSGAIVTSCSADGRVTYNVAYQVGVTYEYSVTPPAPAPVPLPAGGLLLLSGVAGLAIARRRRG